jgi:hypothetical protein
MYMRLSLCSINCNCIYVTTGSFVPTVLHLKFASYYAVVIWLCPPISTEDILKVILIIQKLHEIWKSLRGNKEDILSTVIGDFLGKTLTDKKVSSSELSEVCTIEMRAVVDIKM